VNTSFIFQRPQHFSAEDKAVAQLKSLFESIAMDSDKTVDRMELQAAVEKNAQLQTSIAEANLNQLDTTKDGRIGWKECESHLRADGHAGSLRAVAVRSHLPPTLNKIKADDDGVSTAASTANDTRIEEAVQNQCCLCASH